jgi:hypothetical protein
VKQAEADQALLNINDAMEQKALRKQEVEMLKR